MKRYGSLTMVLCLLLCATAFAYAARPAPGSYFTKAVSNVDDVCRLIKQDPKVAARFTKHFGMSTDEVCAYFRDNLRLTKLPKGARYMEYFIDVRGRMVSHFKYVEAGVPVLATELGIPVLDMRCGNPMTKQLPKPIAKAVPKVIVKVAPQVQETPPPPPPAPVAPEPVVTPPPAPVETEPVTQVLAQGPQEFTFSPVTVGAGVLALLPLLGGGAVTGENQVTPVPEPSSMVVLLSGITGLAVCRRRRR